MSAQDFRTMVDQASAEASNASFKVRTASRRGECSGRGTLLPPHSGLCRTWLTHVLHPGLFSVVSRKLSEKDGHILLLKRRGGRYVCIGRKPAR